VRLVLQMLREGIDRITIWQNMAKHAKIPISTIDNYISEAKHLLEMEQAKIDEAVTADRINRALEASKKIPTNEELIATLARKIDLSKPDITGYELKIINGEVNNVQRFASETFYLTALSKIIEYNNKLNGTDQPQQTQAVLVINTNEVLITNEDDLTDE